MFGLGKKRAQNRDTANARLVKKVMGKDCGRRVFGFACSPDIPAKLKLLASKLNVPLYALAEHMLQLAVGVTTEAVENPKEADLLRSHLTEVHVEARAIEKIDAYDQDMADTLNAERQRRLLVDKVAHQLVIHFIRSGRKPEEFYYLAEYGARCKLAIASGQPVPKD